jgi:hypothetical protein
MKYLMLILLVVGGYYSYEFFTQASPQAPTARRLAPEGVFFTTERFSENSEAGVRALKIGSRVKLLSKQGNSSVVVDDEKNQFVLPSHILNNDLDVRDAVLKTVADENERARQGAEIADIVANESRDARRERMADEIEKTQFRISELKLARSRAEEELNAESARKTLSGRATPDALRITAKISQLDAQIKVSERQIEDLNMQIQRESLGNP